MRQHDVFRYRHKLAILVISRITTKPVKHPYRLVQVVAVNLRDINGYVPFSRKTTKNDLTISLRAQTGLIVGGMDMAFEDFVMLQLH